MNTKKEYIAPTLTAVTFKAEQGYASSGFRLFQDLMFFEQDYDPDYNTQAQENWHDDGGAFGSGW